jgi:hypothetical protein
MDDLAGRMLRLVGIIPYELDADPDAIGWSAALAVADCSSAVKWCGANSTPPLILERTADEQYRQTEGSRIPNPSAANLRRNDLLFFGGWTDPTNPPGYAGVQHVAVSLGGDGLVQEGGGNAEHSSIENVNVGTVSAYGSHFLYATRPLGGPMSVPVSYTGAGLGVATVRKNPAVRVIDVATGQYRIPSADSYVVRDMGTIGPGPVGAYVAAVPEPVYEIEDAGDRALLLARNADFVAAPGSGLPHVLQLTDNGQAVGPAITL